MNEVRVALSISPFYERLKGFEGSPNNNLQRHQSPLSRPAAVEWHGTVIKARCLRHDALPSKPLRLDPHQMPVAN